MNWPPPAELIPNMPVDQLAISLLRELQTRGQRAFARNYVVSENGMSLSRGIEYHTTSIKSAINEAWEWLFVNGFTVQDPDQPDDHRRLSRRGIKAALDSDALRDFRSERLLAVRLHPVLESRVRSIFMMGSYESAVLEAFKQLEVRVRDSAGFENSIYGRELMQKAFGKSGPLADTSHLHSEMVGIMELFSGAMCAIKNPSSHRNVDYDDPTVAAEAIIFADLLHRILDRSGRTIKIVE
jgi:uncharacterized protein (TIGR02391 family)